MMIRRITLALALAAGTTLAQGPQASSDKRAEIQIEIPEAYRIDNAALLYYRYWMIGESQFPVGVMEHYNGAEPGWRPSEEFAKELENAQDTIKGYLKASRIPFANWAVEYDEGVMALLPHLAKLRHTARILTADARRLMELGEVEQAAERIAALYRMGEQTASDRVLISTLVGIAISSLANLQVEEIIATEELTEEAREIMLEAIEAIDLDNPAGVRDAVLGERDLFIGNLRQRYTGPTAGADFVREMFPMMGVSPDAYEEIKARIAQFDEAALQADLDKANRYYEDILSIWDLADAGDRIEQMSGLIENGHYGITGRFMLPAMSRVWESSQKFSQSLTETRRLLESARVVRSEDDTKDDG